MRLRFVVTLISGAFLVGIIVGALAFSLFGETAKVVTSAEPDCRRAVAVAETIKNPLDNLEAILSIDDIRARNARHRFDAANLPLVAATVQTVGDTASVPIAVGDSCFIATPLVMPLGDVRYLVDHALLTKGPGDLCPSGTIVTATEPLPDDPASRSPKSPWADPEGSE